MPFTRPMGPSSPKAKPKLTANLITTSASSSSIAASAAYPQTIVFAKSAIKQAKNDKNGSSSKPSKKGADEVVEKDEEVEGDKTAKESQTTESEYMSIVWLSSCIIFWEVDRRSTSILECQLITLVLCGFDTLLCCAHAPPQPSWQRRRRHNNLVIIDLTAN